MSGLVERANKIEIALGDLKRNEADADLDRTLVETSARVAGLISQLQGAVEINRLLSKDGLKIPRLANNKVESAMKAKSNARKTATNLEKPDQGGQEIVGILNGKGVQDGALGEGETTAKALAQGFETALEGERQALLPKNLQDQIPDGVPHTFKLHRALLKAREVLVTPVSVTPTDLAAGPEPIRDARTTRKSAAEAWKKNHSDLVELIEKEDPEIQKFFREASSPDGASLSALTDNVSKRLKKDDLTDSYRIHFR
jgi:hypothetical protein